VTIGMREGPTAFSQWINRFGFGRPTGLDFPGEERGIVPARDDYSGSTMGNLPIGQGLAVTPMQMATAYSAIANGGVLRRPTLIKSIGGQPADQDTDPHRVISSRVAAQLRRMLEGVLEPGGTASSVSVPGYVLAGKTGTAQKVEHGTYSDTEYVASFVGFAPAAAPEAPGRRGGGPAALRAFRRGRRSARVRADRGLRAALPRDLAALGGSGRGG
jgi:cell division protein FtsI/penicillin-binding protein 2